MTITKLTEWAVKNKVKLEFTDKYDDSVKEGSGGYDFSMFSQA